MANPRDAEGFPGHGNEFLHAENSRDRIYMDYNATTPVAPEVIQATYEALRDAWGNPSSSYVEGTKAKALITRSRESLARMVGGNPEDVFFTSGGTESNNMVLHSAIEHFRRQHPDDGSLPHIISCDVEHDSVKKVAEHLKEDGRADFTFVAVSKVTGRVEADDVIAAVRPTTCLVSIMLANNETGVIMPIREISERVRSLKQRDERARVLVHTDAAQALGKIPVDVKRLAVDYLTIVGHKFYGPRISALYVNGPGVKTPLYPLLIGGGQEKNYRPGTENTPMIAGLGKAAELVTAHLSDYESHMLDVRDYLEERLKAAFGDKLHFNNHFQGSDRLPNTCNVSILGQGLQGWRVLSRCKKLLASVGAACHSDRGDRPSPILLSCGVTPEVASNALRLSVGRKTSRADVDAAVEDLQEAVKLLEQGR
ncbi:selenocysteine lyase [Syngnathoides biaculeatus]|uniref:selenocysteine lyase n=1 Tax=Syngnathoides biaculeatus TaxID=300417 RepID=UPI002ADD573C|nr:selenocysteine lyase [Syngnathoides biaculeatus]XP_061680983.1 selenocysteine lyase [Syngnathoides biaculeatus]XP_061680985.1 selenocysteine lyase [Syngnathoides biaculeatus]